MAALLAEPWAGLLALSALLLWPGLLVVRAPWPFVPFLSLAFWLASWGFLSPAGPGRQRFLLVTLGFSVLLSGLRLLKPFAASRPSGPTLVALALALGRLLPFFLWPVAPGLDAGFTSASALLLVWRDGLPASYAPLYPTLGFGAGEAGLAALAADVSLLAGTTPYRALLLATLASEGLLILALFALARRSWSERGPALVAVAVASVGLLAWSRGDDTGGTVLAVALAICGGSLVVRSCGRSPRVAAGLLWAGAAVLSPLVVLAGVVASGLAVARAGGWRALGRLALPAALAAAFSAPWLWRTTAADRFAVPGLLTLLPVGALALALGFCAVGARRSGPRAFALWVAIALAATLADWGWRSTQVRVTADHVAAAAWLRRNSRAMDAVCVRDEAAGAWLPALAGRATEPPRWPASVRASRLVPARAACGFVWSEDGSPTAPAGFRQGRVSVSPIPSPGSALSR
jgi:hypothetical protein